MSPENKIPEDVAEVIEDRNLSLSVFDGLRLGKILSERSYAKLPSKSYLGIEVIGRNSSGNPASAELGEVQLKRPVEAKLSIVGINSPPGAIPGTVQIFMDLDSSKLRGYNTQQYKVKSKQIDYKSRLEEEKSNLAKHFIIENGLGYKISNSPIIDLTNLRLFAFARPYPRVPKRW